MSPHIHGVFGPNFMVTFLSLVVGAVLLGKSLGLIAITMSGGPAVYLEFAPYTLLAGAGLAGFGLWLVFRD